MTRENDVETIRHERHPFDRGGLAALSDLDDPRYQELFSALEREQARFLGEERRFRSPEYKWPRDPLHCWSRVWEYPYAYHHLRQWRRSAQAGERPPVAVDVGTGVTFFPFAVAGLGYDVICTDVDPVCQRDLEEATKHVRHGPRAITSLLIDGSRLPVADGAASVVTCVSVLEHIPSFGDTIAEMARVLQRGGLLVLTIDLDLGGNAEIGVEKHAGLMTALSKEFVPAFPDITVHPADALYSWRGPHPLWVAPSGAALLWSRFKGFARRALLRPQPEALRLAVQGLVLRRA
jgi:SAM-dependent methyltransferase